MKKITTLALFLTWIGIQSPLIAQDEEKLSLDAGSIDSQFEYVIEESNNYKQYENIPTLWMTKLRSHVADTLQTIHSNVRELQEELQKREEQITALKKDLQSTRDTLALTRTAQDEMAFVGIGMEKSTYRATMWSIIAVLVLLLLIFIIRFNRSHAITRQSKEALASVQAEFDEHRKRSLEREQKLRRELQDELNKQRRQK